MVRAHVAAPVLGCVQQILCIQLLIEKRKKSILLYLLGYGVMVAPQTLTLLVQVRALVPLPVNGDYSVVACTLVCETGSTGSIPVSHPKQ